MTLLTADPVLRLPEKIRSFLQVLEESGFEVWAVGGSVRDLLRGEMPKDWDFTTNAAPRDIEAAFLSHGYPAVPTGGGYGTVTVRFEGQPMEVTPYRVDGSSLDHRHPEEVRLARSLEEDLCRRDFTINGMACSREGRVVDLFGGLSDLHAGVLRPIGAGERRFFEDALRILRGFRFSAQLGFRMTGGALDAAEACGEYLRQVSAERIWGELKKMLAAEPAEPLSQMGARGILHWILPAYSGKVREGIRRVSGLNLGPQERVTLRLAILFAQMPFPQAEERLERLRLEGRVRESVLRLLRARELPFPTGQAELKRRMDRQTPEGLLRWLYFQECRGFSGCRVLRRECRQILDNGECWSVRMLAIGGRELAARGLRGAEIGHTLALLLEEVRTGRVENQAEELIRFLEK